MTSNYHTPPSDGAEAKMSVIREPLSELDQAITTQVSALSALSNRVDDVEADLPTPSGSPTEYYNGNGGWTVPEGTGASVDGHVIQDEGVALPQRAIINFVGGGVTVTNEAGGTQVQIPGATGGVQSVVAGTNVIVDDTDPENPIVSASAVQAVVAGAGISVDNTDPENPVVSVVGGGADENVVTSLIMAFG